MSSSVDRETRPIRVLHLCGNVGPTSGGLGPIALGASAAQRALGHEPAIWTLRNRTTSGEASWRADAPGLARATMFSTRGPAALGYSPEMQKAALFGDGATFDILHQHSIWLATSRVTQQWRAAHQRPTVIAPQGTLESYTMQISRWKKRLAWYGYELDNLRNATCFQATAEDEAASIRRLGLSNPIALIPNGVPEEALQHRGDARLFRERHAISPDSRLLVFLSRLHVKKGLPLLFEAMAKMKTELEDWQLVVCGNEDPPGYGRELKRLAREFGVADKIVWAGALFGSDKQDALAAADIFVLPTHSDNFAIVVTEALASGVPVFTTHGAPWRDLETHRCGWWVPVTADAIRNGLTRALGTPRRELDAMGERGRALVAEKYTWPMVSSRMIQLYEWLLGRRGRPEFVMMD